MYILQKKSTILDIFETQLLSLYKSYITLTETDANKFSMR